MEIINEKFKKLVDKTKIVAKTANGIGIWKIANWAVNAIMPVSVKLPVRVCVRVATWAVSGLIEEKSNEYIDRVTDSTTKFITATVEETTKEIKDEEVFEADEVDALGFKTSVDENAGKIFFTHNDKDQAVDLLCEIQELIEQYGGTPEEMSTIELVSNMVANPREFSVVMPIDIGFKYKLLIEEKGGES